ncbi:MAG TPA: LLM class flavin-dependent oxidoreductase [Candidatus Binataceae bacterium]|nr:LLM class flavin-dependent oxidoreductase [Candidatus Binataceae bacterium]
MLPVGYLPCTQDPPAGKNMARVIDEIVAEARAAEASGWDGCFITEHHQQEDGYLPNPLLMAGLVAMKTQRIKVGTCVLLLPLYHPVRVAEDCAIVDQASDGRLILSIGVGYQQHDFDAFEVPISARVARTEEGLEIVRRSWKGERFSFDGAQFKLKDTLVTPAPFQAGGPPVWMASWTPPGLRRAARIADGWIADPVQSLPVIKGFAERYRAECTKLGRKPYICLMRDAVIADSMAAAEAASAPTMTTHRFYFKYGAYVPDDYIKDVKSPEEFSFKTAAKDRLIVGSPKDCLDQLQMWQEAIRPDYLILRIRQPGGPSHETAVAAIRTFGESVIPKL